MSVTSVLEPQPGTLICLCIPEKALFYSVLEEVAFGGMTCVWWGEAEGRMLNVEDE